MPYGVDVVVRGGLVCLVHEGSVLVSMVPHEARALLVALGVAVDGLGVDW